MFLNSRIYYCLSSRCFVGKWDDIGYKTHLQAFISEYEWSEMKMEILRIYAEHNAKKTKLYNLVKCNPYRSMLGLSNVFWLNICYYFCCGCCREINPSTSDPSLFMTWIRSLRDFLFTVCFIILVPLTFFWFQFFFILDSNFSSLLVFCKES